MFALKNLMKTKLNSNYNTDLKYDHRTKIIQQSSPYHLQCISPRLYYEKRIGNTTYNFRENIIQKDVLSSFNIMKNVYSEKDIDLWMSNDFRQCIYPILLYKQQRENIENRAYFNPDIFRKILFIKNSINDYFFTQFFKSGYQNIHVTINNINNILLTNKKQIDVLDLSDKIFEKIDNSFNKFVFKNENLFNVIIELLSNIKSVLSDLSINLNVSKISNKIRQLKEIHNSIYFREDIIFSINCFLNYNNLDFIFITDILSYVTYYKQILESFDFIDIKIITEVNKNLVSIIVNYFKNDTPSNNFKDATLEDLEIQYTLNGERKNTNNFFYIHYEKNLDNLKYMIKKMFAEGFGNHKIKVIIS